MIAPDFSAISASAERTGATTAVIGARTEATTAVTAETTGVTGVPDRGCSGRQMTRRRLGRFPPLPAAPATGLWCLCLGCRARFWRVGRSQSPG